MKYAYARVCAVFFFYRVVTIGIVPGKWKLIYCYDCGVFFFIIIVVFTWCGIDA